MLKLFNRNSKKGFTLVEVIVVLVIMAILAAIFIPALTGYIDKANQRRYIAEARSVYLAAQTILSEQYGLDNTKLTGTTYTVKKDSKDGLEGAINELSEVETDYTATITCDEATKAKIVTFVYVTGGYSVTYEKGAWGPVEAVTTPAAGSGN